MVTERYPKVDEYPPQVYPSVPAGYPPQGYPPQPQSMRHATQYQQPPPKQNEVGFLEGCPRVQAQEGPAKLLGAQAHKVALRVPQAKSLSGDSSSLLRSPKGRGLITYHSTGSLCLFDSVC
ncbi:hypothetical protein CRG98_008819 [Punica granatum]|uniref:Uncharacterized protein n=1 Tax=Punica granatum TaxID=22663 RepID=A0A2I0KQR9_PUNGR|nr:hypothetical protein CRG98_008819 [Punica granatum]